MEEFLLDGKLALEELDPRVKSVVVVSEGCSLIVGDLQGCNLVLKISRRSDLLPHLASFLRHLVRQPELLVLVRLGHDFLVLGMHGEGVVLVEFD